MTSSSQLVMTQGPEPGQAFPLDKDALGLGREPSNDIVINHPQVSRRHARITRQGGFMVIEDLGSTNGTFANGMRLSGPHTLASGDVIGLGEAVLLTYRAPDTAATERLVGRPMVAPPPPTHAAPFLDAQPPPPAHSIPPPPLALPEEEKKDRGWLRIGCGCLAILIVTACVGVFVLDYLKILPAFFYEPLRWLGII
jgi:hypothetical protein